MTVEMPARGKAEEALARLGIDASLPPDEAVAQLAALRGQPGVSDTAVARALGAIPSREAAVTLAKMEATASGANRREIRRALFRLHQRGIVPPVEQAAAPPATIAPAREALVSALLSPIDSAGARVVWIMKARAQGGITRLFGLSSEFDGLLGVTTASLSRKELRIERADVERRGRFNLVDADWTLADYILCEAWRATAEPRRAAVGNFLTLRSEVLSTAPPSSIVHPIYDELAAELEPEPPRELLDLPEFSQWKLPPEDIAAFVTEINEIRQSPILLNRYQQEERVSAVIERAIDALLTGERGTKIRRWIEDTGYYWLRAGQREHAVWAARAAALLRNGGDVKRNVFFQAFIRNQLGAKLAEKEAQEREEAHLVVTPAEAMRTEERRRRAGR